MLMVVRVDNEKEEAEILFESESYTECEIFMDELEDKTNVSIEEKY